MAFAARPSGGRFRRGHGAGPSQGPAASREEAVPSPLPTRRRGRGNSVPSEEAAVDTPGGLSRSRVGRPLGPGPPASRAVGIRVRGRVCSVTARGLPLHALAPAGSAPPPCSARWPPGRVAAAVTVPGRVSGCWRPGDGRTHERLPGSQLRPGPGRVSSGPLSCVKRGSPTVTQGRKPGQRNSGCPQSGHQRPSWGFRGAGRRPTGDAEEEMRREGVRLRPQIAGSYVGKRVAGSSRGPGPCSAERDVTGLTRKALGPGRCGCWWTPPCRPRVLCLISVKGASLGLV